MWLVSDSFPFFKNNVTVVLIFIEIILIINSNFGPWRMYFSFFLTLRKLLKLDTALHLVTLQYWEQE